MKPLISALPITFAALMTAQTALAEQVCMSADEMHASLIDWYAEKPVSEPSPTNEQIWASDENGTWTMVKTFADGSACVLAQGDDWMQGIRQDQIVASLAD